MVLTTEYFGEVKRGAFDHWKGETVPVRGPNREIIGEATIKSVDHREDGNVWVIVESELDPEVLGPGLRSVADIVRGRSGMSFQPKRDDDVARWLKAKRDEFSHDMWDSENLFDRTVYVAIDAMLDEYRARADYGLTLDDDLSELPDGY